MGIARDASQDVIKRAYRRLARKYHPDVSSTSDAEDRFKELVEAYEVLRDPEKRALYDREIAQTLRQTHREHVEAHVRDFFQERFGHGGGRKRPGFRADHATASRQATGSKTRLGTAPKMIGLGPLFLVGLLGVAYVLVQRGEDMSGAPDDIEAGTPIARADTSTPEIPSELPGTASDALVSRDLATGIDEPVMAQSPGPSVTFPATKPPVESAGMTGPTYAVPAAPPPVAYRPVVEPSVTLPATEPPVESHGIAGPSYTAPAYGIPLYLGDSR